MNNCRSNSAAVGKVESVSIINDSCDGHREDSLFVKMASVTEGQAAITRVNGTTVKTGRLLSPRFDRARMTGAAAMGTL